MYRNWYAVYTRSRHEKKVAAALSGRGVEVFLPLRNVISRWKDRKKEVQLPLFGGYLFVRIDPAESKLDVLQTGGVVSFVSSAGAGLTPIPEDQIEGIRTLVESGIKFDPYPYIKEGMRVIINKGPLRGVEGLVLSRKKKHILVLSVDLIQQSASLEIDIADTDAR